MSIQDITEYVRKTPGNSNPAVIKSMVESQVTEHVKEAAELATTMVKHDLGIREEKSEPVVVIPNGSYEFSTGGYEVLLAQFPKVGDLITLTLDGVVYSETGKYVFMGNISCVYIGNGVTFGEPDTGENYIAIFLEEEGVAGIILLDEAENEINTIHTVELSFAAPPVITPISDKYLPTNLGSGLPVVELTTPLRSEYPEGVLDLLTESDGVALEAAIATKMPFAIRCVVTMEDMQLTMTGCCIGTVVGNIPFSAAICAGGPSYVFMRANDGWAVGMV